MGTLADSTSVESSSQAGTTRHLSPSAMGPCANAIKGPGEIHHSKGYESPIASRLENVDTVKAVTPILLDTDVLHSAVANFRASYMQDIDFRGQEGEAPFQNIDSCRRNLFPEIPSSVSSANIGSPSTCDSQNDTPNACESIRSSQDSLHSCLTNSPVKPIDLTSQNDTAGFSELSSKSSRIAIHRELIASDRMQNPIPSEYSPTKADAYGCAISPSSKQMPEEEEEERQYTEVEATERVVPSQGNTENTPSDAMTTDTTYPAKGKTEEETLPRVRKRYSSHLSGIVGLKAAKEALYEALVLPRLFPASLFTGIRTVPSTILLQGAPGTGKTALVKAMAIELDMPLYCVTPSSIISKWAGESERTLREVFHTAATACNRPMPIPTQTNAQKGGRHRYHHRYHVHDTNLRHTHPPVTCPSSSSWDGNSPLAGYIPLAGHIHTLQNVDLERSFASRQEAESTDHIPRAIVFIDEIDAFAMKREDNSGDVSSRRLLNELLLLMTEYTTVPQDSSASSASSVQFHSPQIPLYCNSSTQQISHDAAQSSEYPHHSQPHGDTAYLRQPLHHPYRPQDPIEQDILWDSQACMDGDGRLAQPRALEDGEMVTAKDSAHTRRRQRASLGYNQSSPSSSATFDSRQKMDNNTPWTGGVAHYAANSNNYRHATIPNASRYTPSHILSNNCVFDSETHGLIHPSGVVSQKRYPIVVIAATNRVEDLDPAIVRRFSRRIQCDLPNFQSRCELVQKALQGISHSLSSEDIAYIADATDQWNGSDILDLISEAAMKPLREVLHRHVRSFFGDEETNESVNDIHGHSSTPVINREMTSYRGDGDARQTTEQREKEGGFLASGGELRTSDNAPTSASDSVYSTTAMPRMAGSVASASDDGLYTKSTTPNSLDESNQKCSEFSRHASNKCSVAGVPSNKPCGEPIAPGVLRPVTLTDVKMCLLVVKPSTPVTEKEAKVANGTKREHRVLFGRKRARVNSIRQQIHRHRRR